MELAPSSTSWEVRAFSAVRVLISAAAVEQLMGWRGSPLTCFSGAGALGRAACEQGDKITTAGIAHVFIS